MKAPFVPFYRDGTHVKAFFFLLFLILGKDVDVIDHHHHHHHINHHSHPHNNNKTNYHHYHHNQHCEAAANSR